MIILSSSIDFLLCIDQQIIDITAILPKAAQQIQQIADFPRFNNLVHHIVVILILRVE